MSFQPEESFMGATSVSEWRQESPDQGEVQEGKPVPTWTPWGGERRALI